MSPRVATTGYEQLFLLESGQNIKNDIIKMTQLRIGSSSIHKRREDSVTTSLTQNTLDVIISDGIHTYLLKFGSLLNLPFKTHFSKIHPNPETLISGTYPIPDTQYITTFLLIHCIYRITHLYKILWLLITIITVFVFVYLHT